LERVVSIEGRVKIVPALITDEAKQIEGFMEEAIKKRSSAAVRKLLDLRPSMATVIRDGKEREVRIADIVPGDIIRLSAGDVVPADARVITAKDLFVDQSALTGESFPVEKIYSPLDVKAAPVAEWNNCVLLGSSVVSGTAHAVVASTGNTTEYGKIAQKLVAKEPETEFDTV
jgi:Mg2+-importing ATPase